MQEEEQEAPQGRSGGRSHRVSRSNPEAQDDDGGDVRPPTPQFQSS